MKITPNLSKENFWNDLFDKYPDAVKIFCKWIDKYKKRNKWNTLFNSDSDWQDVNGKNAPAPKFHDLPYAMQIGILIEFLSSYPTVHEFEVEDLFTLDWRKNITEFFQMLQQSGECRKAFIDHLKETKAY
jgi:hypothetical protein